jgi:purine-nucleoside phosphorylase
MLEQIQKISAWISKKLPQRPEYGIILGSGLSHLGDRIEPDCTIPYSSIPGFPVSTVAGHSGQMISGRLAGKQLLAMKGRFHFYEGYTMDQVILPIRVMGLLGVHTLILSNAAGGMDPGFKIGDIMLIEDHINLMGTNPLIGQNIDELGPRFPDMSCVYDHALRILAAEIATSSGISLQHGVYAAVTGPTYETPAEYRYIRRIGADAVGMSTVPEAIAARHMGMKLLGFSIITDLGLEGHVEAITHEEVVAAASAAEPKLSALITEIVRRL